MEPESLKCPACDGTGDAGVGYDGEVSECHYCDGGRIKAADVIDLRDRFEELVGDAMIHRLKQAEWDALSNRERDQRIMSATRQKEETMNDRPDKRTCACCLIEFGVAGGVLLPVRDGWGRIWLCHDCRPKGHSVEPNYWCHRCYPKADAR